MLANADCTVYHKTYCPETRLDKWIPTQYKGVNWYAKRAVSIGNNGLNDANTLTVEIPTQDKSDKFSAQAGDIIVKGLFEKTVFATNQIPNENRFTITAVQDNRSGSPAIRHWRVEGT